MLLDAAADDIPDTNHMRRLMRDLREVRMAKLREGVKVLEGGREVRMNGVGGMEIAEGRAFISGVVDGLRSGLCRRMSDAVADLLGEIGKSELPRSFRERRERRKKEKMGSVARMMMMMIGWIYR